MKKRQPRKLKKQIHKANLIIDLASIPKAMGYDLSERINIQLNVFQETGVVFWDSTQPGAVKPEIVGCKSKLKIKENYEYSKHKK